MTEFYIKDNLDVKTVMGNLQIDRDSGEIDLKTFTEVLHLDHEDWSMYERFIHSVLIGCGRPIEDDIIDRIISASRMCIQSTIIDDDIIDSATANYKLIALSDILKYHWMEKLFSTGLFTASSLQTTRQNLNLYHILERSKRMKTDNLFEFYKKMAILKSSMLYIVIEALRSLDADKIYISSVEHKIEGLCIFALLHDDIFDLKSDLESGKSSSLIILADSDNIKYDVYFKIFPSLYTDCKKNYADCMVYVPDLMIQRLELFFAESNKVRSGL